MVSGQVDGAQAVLSQIRCLGFRDQGSGFRDQGLGFRVQGAHNDDHTILGSMGSPKFRITILYVNHNGT